MLSIPKYPNLVNCLRTLTELRAKHTGDAGRTMGVNGTTGKIQDMNDLGVWEPLSVKLQGLSHISFVRHYHLYSSARRIMKYNRKSL